MRLNQAQMLCLKPAPPVQVQPALPRRARAARPLAQTVSARAATSKAYICVDCGYIYDGSDGAFEKLPNSYR